MDTNTTEFKAISTEPVLPGKVGYENSAIFDLSIMTHSFLLTIVRDVSNPRQFPLSPFRPECTLCGVPEQHTYTILKYENRALSAL